MEGCDWPLASDVRSVIQNRCFSVICHPPHVTSCDVCLYTDVLITIECLECIQLVSHSRGQILEVLARRRIRGVNSEIGRSAVFYLVQWKGNKRDSWESVETLRNCRSNALKEFYAWVKNEGLMGRYTISKPEAQNSPCFKIHHDKIKMKPTKPKARPKKVIPALENTKEMVNTQNVAEKQSKETSDNEHSKTAIIVKSISKLEETTEVTINPNNGTIEVKPKPVRRAKPRSNPVVSSSTPEPTVDGKVTTEVKIQPNMEKGSKSRSKAVVTKAKNVKSVDPQKVRTACAKANQVLQKNLNKTSSTSEVVSINNTTVSSMKTSQVNSGKEISPKNSKKRKVVGESLNTSVIIKDNSHSPVKTEVSPNTCIKIKSSSQSKAEISNRSPAESSQSKPSPGSSRLGATVTRAAKEDTKVSGVMNRSTSPGSRKGATLTRSTKPELAKPHVKKPDLAKPNATKPQLAKPIATKPDLAKPIATKPDLAKPIATKPDLAKPIATKADLAKQNAIKPDLAKPNAPKPDPSKLNVTQHDLSKPNADKNTNKQIVNTEKLKVKLTKRKATSKSNDQDVKNVKKLKLKVQNATNITVESDQTFIAKAASSSSTKSDSKSNSPVKVKDSGSSSKSAEKQTKSNPDNKKVGNKTAAVGKAKSPQQQQQQQARGSNKRVRDVLQDFDEISSQGSCSAAESDTLYSLNEVPGTPSKKLKLQLIDVKKSPMSSRASTPVMEDDEVSFKISTPVRKMLLKDSMKKKQKYRPGLEIQGNPAKKLKLELYDVKKSSLKASLSSELALADIPRKKPKYAAAEADSGSARASLPPPPSSLMVSTSYKQDKTPPGTPSQSSSESTPTKTLESDFTHSIPVMPLVHNSPAACYKNLMKNLQNLQADRGMKNRKPGESSEPVERRTSVRQSESVYKYKDIVVKKCAGYTQIWLFSQNKMKNSLNPQVLSELIQALHNAKFDDSRLVMLAGTGSVFCSGIDLSYIAHTLDFKKNAKKMAESLKEFLNVLISFPKPLVAAVNGSAIGLGAAILPLCDIVYASDKASFYCPYTKLNQTPEGCASYTFPQVMGSAMANEMLLGGRKITATEACQVGLVSQVFWPDGMMQSVILKLQGMAQHSAKALEASKLLIRSHQKSKLEFTCDSECTLLTERWASPDCIKAHRTYLDKEQDFFL